MHFITRGLTGIFEFDDRSNGVPDPTPAFAENIDLLFESLLECEVAAID